MGMTLSEEDVDVLKLLVGHVRVTFGRHASRVFVPDQLVVS